MDLLNSFLDIISKSLGIIVIVGGCVLGGYRLFLWRYRTEDAHKRIDDVNQWKDRHDIKCERRYSQMLKEFKEMRSEQNQSLSQMHEKINKISIKVAENH